MKFFEKSITAGGKTVQIKVTDDGADGWLLEIVDEYWNSTCWQSPFDSSEAAFIEAESAIQTDGIDAFIGAGQNSTH